MSNDFTDRFREEYIRKSNLVNRTFLIILGLSLILLLFVILPYYLSLEHLDNLQDMKRQLESDFILLKNFNKSFVGYLNDYEQISEPLIDNDFKDISTRIYTLVNTGKGIYPECEHLSTSGQFFKCNITLIADSEYNYLVNNQSRPILSRHFGSIFDNWEIDYLPKITNIEQELKRDYIAAINNSDTISSILTVGERLNGITKIFFEQGIPKEIISIFMGSVANVSSSNIVIEEGEASFRGLLMEFAASIRDNENNIENTTALVSSISERIGAVQTPLVSFALGFEEIMIFSPIVLAVSYLACIFILLEAIMFKKNNLDSDKMIAGLNPLLFDASNSKNKALRLVLLTLPLFVFIISTALILSIWKKSDVFFIFKDYFEIFFIMYIIFGIGTTFMLWLTIKKQHEVPQDKR